MMEGVERWRSTTSAVLLILMAVGVFPVIANGLLKEGLYVSNKTDILFIFNPEYSITARPVSVYKQAGRLTGLAYDKCNEQLYWSNVDVVNRGIYRGSLDADGNVNNVTKIIATDVLEVSGLTFDWVSKHLYWTDSRKKTVEVSDADGGNRRVLVMTGKGAPRGIYADPINGYLFWTDQGQKHIARSRLDGSEQTVIVTQGVDLPNQIVVYKNKLYWVDSSKKTFESSDLSGGQRKTSTITPANGQHIFGLAIHDDRAHITNWMNGQLIGIDTNGSNIARGIQNVGKDELFSAIYVSSMYQPKRNDPCANKRCSGLCLPVRANEARCTCPSYGGKILGTDGMSCIAPTNPILMVAMADSGYVGFFDASNHSKTDFYVVGRSLRPVAVAYDPVTKNVFWSDVRERTIHLANIDGTNHRILLRNSHGIGLVEGMLVDVARRQFYYTNIGSVLINGTAYSWHRIETFSLRSLTDVKVKTIVMTADKPRGLALDSTRNHLYYTDWGNRASIVRVNLDGSDPTLIRTGLENPNGIVFLNNRIYFVDSHFKSRQGTDGGGSQPPKNGSLYSINPNGSDLRDILATTGVKLRTPFGLTATTSGSGLYVGDWETETLYLLNLNGTLSRTILQGTSGLMSLSYTQFTATAERTSCDSKTCGDICLPKSSFESSCNCNSYGGKSIINGGTSCSVPNNFLIVADMNSIKIVSQDGKDSNPYIAVQGVPFTSNYVALAFDNGRRIVYYSDISRKEISALHMSNMTSMSLYRINEVIDGMVYHSGSLYWTDYTNGRISRLNLSPTSGQGLRHEILVRDLSRPRAIRIHDNYIYWTEWGGIPKVSRKALSGVSSVEQMYRSLKLVWPNGISIFNQKLHLVDGSTKKIYRCGLNPTDNCEVITGTEKVLKHAYDLWATDGEVFYYSDWETGSIKAFDKNKPTKTWTIVDGLMRPTQFQFSPLSSRPNKFCDNETDTKYSIHWNRTIAGTNSSEPCPWNPTGWCSRECLPNTIWSQPTCNSCADKKFNDFFVRVNKLNLTALDNQNVTAKIASDLSTATNNSEGLTPGNLKASVELIKLLSDAIQRNDSNATINEMEIKSIVKAASNVLRPNNSESWETLKKENQNIATSILLSLDNYGRSLAALNISENRKEEENLILEAWSFEKSNLREIEFPSRSLWDEDRGDGISISVEALQSRMLSGRPTLNMWGSYYRTVNEYLPGHKDTDVVNSRVLSFSIDGLKTNEELKRPVIITLRHNQENRTGFQRKCAFWNFGSGTWDFDGCSVTLTNRTHTICSCNHLTNFAILMSLTPKEEDKLLSLISVIGCSISAAALILTILIYALTWKQSKSAQATVLLNLCVALASAYLIFLAGADKFGEEKYQDGCTAVAVLLHYFFLAAFFIMLIEGVELVLYIIFVFHVRRTRETIMLIVSAWVLPLIIVGVSLGSTRFDGYGHKNACWLSAEKGLIWAFIGPVLFIVTANFVILIVVLSWMSKKKALLAKNGKKRDEIRATIWNLSVTCPVLGLGWLFGVLNLISDDVFFQYLFVIVNSLQGLLIFIFHALFHNKKMNEKISSFYSNYICRCRKSKLSVSTQITSAQEQSTSTTAASKATIEMTSAQEQSTSTTAASKATIEMTSAQEQSTSSILALTATTEISSAQEQSTSSTPALTTITEMTLAQEQATSSTSVTKVSTEMSSAQEQSTSSTRASASTTEVTSSQEQSTSSTSTSKVTTEMSCDQEQSTSSTSAKDSSAANKKPTDKAKVVPRAVKYYEDLIGRAGQFAQRCSAAYDQWRL